MFGKSLAFGAAIALAASPTLAQPSAGALSVRPSIDRAGAPEGSSHLNGGSWLPPALFALIVIGGVLLATGVLFDDDHDTPASP